jgi:hypothetical protein
MATRHNLRAAGADFTSNGDVHCGRLQLREGLHRDHLPNVADGVPSPESGSGSGACFHRVWQGLT